MAKHEKMPRQIIAMGWISFFADICSEMVYPVIPLFLKSIGATLGAQGLIEGSAEAVVSLMKGWSGWHSDKTGKRLPFVRWGYGLSALGKPLLAAASTWPMVMGGRLLDRIGKGVRTTARDALIADSVDKSRIGAAFGFHRGMDTAGALVGVTVALGLIAFNTPYKWIFLVAGVPGAVSVALTLKLTEKENDAGVTNQKELIRSFPPSYWIALSASLLFGLANSSDTFLLRRASDLGLSATGVILAYALYNITYMILSYPMGKWSDNVGRWIPIASGWIIYALVYFGFSLAGSSSLWMLFALYGVYMGLTQGTGKALIVDFAPPEAKGTALGIFYLSTGFVTLLASVLVGIVWDRAGASMAFQIDAALALLAVFTIPLLRSLQRRVTTDQ